MIVAKSLGDMTKMAAAVCKVSKWDSKTKESYTVHKGGDTLSLSTGTVLRYNHST